MATATRAGTGQEHVQDEARSVAADAAGKAGAVAGSAVDDARSVAADARGEAMAVAEEAKAKARDLAGETKQQLRSQAEQQAGRAAEAMRQVSTQLSSMAAAAPDGGLAPDLARQASSTIDQLAGRLDAGGLDSLVADVKRYARNKPGMFLLGAAAAGVLAGRLARSTDTQALAEAAKPSGGGSVADPAPAAGTPPHPAERPLRAPGH